MGELRTEPSMEEILASIKRIIADDSLTPGSRGRARSEPVEAETPRPVDRDEPLASPQDAGGDAPATAVLTESPAPTPVAMEPPERAPAPVMVAPPAAAQPPVDHPRPAALVSDDAASASRHALSALSAMVVRTPGADNTLDGLVREMLKPLLKEWLDQRLPDLVETLVAREIARITDKSL